jgi:hypothetical protein
MVGAGGKLSYNLMLTQLSRALLKPRLLLAVRLSAPYATQEKVNVVVVPRNWQLMVSQSVNLQTQIETSPTCKTLAVLIKVGLPPVRKTWSSFRICILGTSSTRSGTGIWWSTTTSTP